jgi:hypothetical protein
MAELSGVFESRERLFNKHKRGGSRKGSGAKPQYNEETITFGVRCPVSKVDELKKIINQKLKEWKKK